MVGLFLKMCPHRFFIGSPIHNLCLFVFTWEVYFTLITFALVWIAFVWIHFSGSVFDVLSYNTLVCMLFLNIWRR